MCNIFEKLFLEFHEMSGAIVEVVLCTHESHQKIVGFPLEMRWKAFKNMENLQEKKCSPGGKNHCFSEPGDVFMRFCTALVVVGE